MRTSLAVVLSALVLGTVRAQVDAGVPRCTAAPADAVRPELDRLEKALAQNPGDPLLLFEQAIAHGQLCEREQTLRSLSAVARTWGGLDPGNFRGFAFLRGDPEFDALVRDIRARNPPVSSSQPGYVFAEPGLFPEGTTPAPSKSWFPRAPGGSASPPG